MGPPSSSLTASAPSASKGLETTSPAPAIATSSALFMDGLPRRGHAAPQVVPERDERRPRDEHVVAGDPDAGGRGDEQQELCSEHDVVEPPVRDERKRREEQDDVEEPRR